MRFNTKSQTGTAMPNHEGEKAWQLTPEMELYTAVVTTSLSNKFYTTAADRIKRIRELIPKVEAEFVAKLAIYAREKMYLRSVPLVLAVELAKVHKGDDLVRRLVGRIVQRADEITELLAYYQEANARRGTKKLGKMSKQIQKGLAKAFNKFDEYQFAKYNREAAVKLKDALFLVHPSPQTKEQQTIFDKIASDTLETPYTWEVELSRTGQESYNTVADKQTAVRRQWEALIESGRLGYMAILRNLRNILQAEVSDTYLDIVRARIADPAQVKRARQFPFRYLSAYNELIGISHPGIPKILEALEAAIMASVDNIKGFGNDTKVMISCDTSGSMHSTVSGKSKLHMYELGLVLGMLLQTKCEAVTTSIFAESHKVVNLPRTNILTNTNQLSKMSGAVGHATNGYKVIQHLLKEKQIVDKVMLFTDCQLWNSAGGSQSLNGLWKRYKKLAPDAKIYIFDLQGYGQAPLKMKGDDVFMIAGWSEKIFDVLEHLENGGKALNAITEIDF